MDAEEFARLSNIKQEIFYEDDEYLYDYDLVKREKEEFGYNYTYDYKSDEIDTNDHRLEDFHEFESEVASNSSETPTVATHRTFFYGCKRCNLEFLDAKDIFKHRAKFHARRKPYKCLICNIIFPAKKNYTCHMLKHSVNKYLYCSICKIMFDKRRDLSKHKLSHLKTASFCHKCNKYFRSKSQYRHHLDTFRTTYFCRICDCSFFYLKCYQQHMINHLRYDKLMQNRSLRQGCYSTKRCLTIKKNEAEIIKINFVSTPLKYRFHRSIYYRKPLDQKLYKCFQCLSTYVSKNNLKKYVRSSKRHSFKCPLCRLGYCASKKLPSPNGHHTRNRLYSCRTCNLKFYDLAQKLKHTKDLQLTKLSHNRNLVHRYIPKKLSTCAMCNWKFPDLLGLKAHVYFSHF